MLLNEIHIRNFKGFVDATFEFHDNFTVIIGNNGSGKTSILDALSIAAGCFLIPLGNGSKYQRTIHKGEIRISETQKSVFEPQLPCEIGAKGDRWKSWKRTIESLSYTNTQKHAKSIVSDAERTLQEATVNDSIILPVFAYHGTGRLWAELTDKVKYTKQGSRLDGYDNCFSVKSSSKSFRDWYKTLEKNIDQKNSEELVQRLQTFKQAILSCLEDWDNLYYDFAEDDIICVRENEDGTKTSVPYRMMSDGYRNMIGMIADIAYRCIKLNPALGANALLETIGLVLIDELDLHLHPQWQKKIVSELTKCFPKIQFVATTHSPFIVQSLKKEQIINLEPIALNDDPLNVSLEMNALYMGVQSMRSNNFDEKVKAAQDFYQALNDYDGTAERRDQIEDTFSKHMINFSTDPAFVAQLKLAKLATLEGRK